MSAQHFDATEASGGGLVGRVVALSQAMRRAGIPTSTSDTVDAVRAIGIMDLTNREILRHSIAATSCKRPQHRKAFDALFDLYFPIRTGAVDLPEQEMPEGGEGQGDGEGEPSPFAPDRDALRDELLDLLLKGDMDELRRFVMKAVSQLGRADGQPGRQSWFSYRVLRALSPETLIAAMLEAMGVERGGMDEKVAREQIRERIQAFEQMVDAEIRRLVAEERGPEALERTAVKPLAEQVDFLRASREDLAELKRQVQPLARRLATRLAAKRRHGHTGRLDIRRTIRSSLATGGVPIEPHFKPYKAHKPELVVLCDVSGSVASFAHFTLLLTSALRDQFSKVRVFAFIDTCDEVTDCFSPGADLADAMERIGREADLVWFDGHSDYGHSFEAFADKYMDAITPKTSLLILGDARTNYRNPAALTVSRIAKQVRHSYWLNPEPKAQWGSGDSATSTYAPLVEEMIECRNATQLTDFITRM